jgi:hypothetical protein
LILQLQPGVPEIVCVGGSSSFHCRWVDETRKSFERRYSRSNKTVISSVILYLLFPRGYSVQNCQSPPFVPILAS